MTRPAVRVRISAHCYDCRRLGRWYGNAWRHQNRPHNWIWTYRFTVNGVTVYTRSGFRTHERATASIQRHYRRIITKLEQQ